MEKLILRLAVGIEPPVIEGDAQAEILLLANFLKFTAKYQGRVCADQVLLVALKSFTQAYLTIDVHSLVATFDADAHKSVLSSYFLALNKLENKLPSEEVPRSSPSALLSAAAKGEASTFRLFGGQGTNEVYFDELRNLYYRPYVGPLIERAEADGLSIYSYGLDVATWPAVAIAASECLDSFTENTVKALKWLFFCGLRGQETLPVLAIDPQLVGDSVEGGEGVPSPMLGVTGLALDILEKHLTDTNQYLATNPRMAISLYNDPKAFVVTGPSRSLYGLVTSLRKIRAPTGLDQSKVPFSQRKAVFSVRFLTVGVPYHSQYLEGVTEKVADLDLEGAELWKPEDLHMPVHHTEDGTDLREATTSLTRSLCDQIFTLPIHWDKATEFPETATHAVDFGPGGMSGGTAHNLDGRGVRVIIMGKKGKGSTELYSTSAVKYESWWSKKFAPKLVKTSDGSVDIDTPLLRH